MKNFNINYKKIITCKDFEKIGKEKFQELEKIGVAERNAFDLKHTDIYNNSFQYNNYILPRRAQEIAFNTSRYNDLSKIEKLILEANIIFPNTEQFVFYLSQEFTFEELQNISNILKRYKQLSSLYKQLNRDFEPDLEVIFPLFERLKLIYGTNPRHDECNKINGILTYHRDLFK